MKRPPWHVRRQRLQKVAAMLNIPVGWWWPNWFIRLVITQTIVRNNDGIVGIDLGATDGETHRVTFQDGKVVKVEKVE